MNIAQAKQQIKSAMTAYFSKDEFGGYRIPIEKQRPVFMIGPPGIGKTAIMEQIAAELGVGLVPFPWPHCQARKADSSRMHSRVTLPRRRTYTCP